MREKCLDTVYELAKKDPRVFFVGSDLGIGVLDKFKKEMPDRFFMEGVAEQNLVGLSAGLAMEGVAEQNLVGLSAGLAMEGGIVYLNTIATFLTRRCYEQVAVDLCLHNVNVRLIANGGGCVYAPLGPTHLAIEDLSIMRALPNMTVVAPADEPEMIRFMHATLNHDGPIYIRIAKGNEPKITGDPGPFVIGKGRVFRDGTDALIATTGVGLHHALPAAEALAKEGINAAVVHFPTVKPLDTELLTEFAEKVPTIVTVEENTVIGGFGSGVIEFLAEADLLHGRRVKRVGIPDVFPNKYGDQLDMIAAYGVSATGIADAVRKLKAETAPRLMVA